MTLWPSVASELPFLRAEAEGMMGETFDAYSPTVTREGNRKTRTLALAYATRGKIAGRGRDTQVRTETIGGTEREIVQGGLHIPLGAAVPEIGWEFVCTAVGPGSDPSLLGRRWRVENVPAKSYATARRLDVTEVPQPQEAP